MKRLESVEAFVCLVTASLLVRLVPFRWLRRYLGDHPRETAPEIGAEAEAQALRVRGLIRGVCRRLDWKPRCLARGVAAIAMLRRRGLEATLYLGVGSDEPGIRGHAWVRCGTVMVVGGVSRWRYTSLGGFSRAP